MNACDALTVRLNIDFEQQVITNLGTADLLALESADGHQTCRRWTSIGDCSRCCDHADIEAERDCSFARAVDALDVVGACSVSHESRMFLNHQDE